MQNLMSVTALNRPTRWALGLGYGGLIPFVGLASAAWLLGAADRSCSLHALSAYGATILSFLGAVHWGFAMREASGPSMGLLVWGVALSLLAWLAMLLTPATGLCLLAVGLWACYGVDRVVYPGFGLDSWLGMRLLLTIVASFSCVAGAARQLLNA